MPDSRQARRRRTSGMQFSGFLGAHMRSLSAAFDARMLPYQSDSGVPVGAMDLLPEDELFGPALGTRGASGAPHGGTVRCGFGAAPPLTHVSTFSRKAATRSCAIISNSLVLTPPSVVDEEGGIRGDGDGERPAGERVEDVDEFGVSDGPALSQSYFVGSVTNKHIDSYARRASTLGHLMMDWREGTRGLHMCLRRACVRSFSDVRVERV